MASLHDGRSSIQDGSTKTQVDGATHREPNWHRPAICSVFNDTPKDPSMETAAGESVAWLLSHNMYYTSDDELLDFERIPLRAA